MQQFTIGPEETGCRADRIVRKKCTLLPLAAIYALFRKGKVRINGKKIKQNYRFTEGEALEIVVDVSEVQDHSKGHTDIDGLKNTSFYKKNFNIIYEDTDLLACNKPSGLVVHPGTGHTRRDTLIDCASAYLKSVKGSGSSDEFALVHRLDRDTSGVILIAKNKRTLRLLHEYFRVHAIVKEYRAVCHNRPPKFEGTITVNLGKTHERNQGMKVHVRSEGVQACSRYQMLSYEKKLSRVAVFLETGKTHQIRVQMAHVGAPIVGDVRYGDSQRDAILLKGNIRRLYLHAYRLQFIHPHTGKKMTITAPVPQEFKELL